jgi:hypothetical protein
MFVYPQGIVDEVRSARAAGATYRQLAERFGVAKRTIGRWCTDADAAQRPAAQFRPAELLRPANYSAYAYILGIYLGDGHLVRMPNGVFALRITLDLRYPAIISEVVSSLETVMPKNRATVRPRSISNAADIVCYSKAWPVLLPQYGAGRKHTRDVSLRLWQLSITVVHAKSLIRGLIHSDGCRFIAIQRVKDKPYAYPRYCFKNRSLEILETFCTHLDLLDIPWTKPGPESIQVARRKGVVALDEFVGAKR